MIGAARGGEVMEGAGVAGVAVDTPIPLNTLEKSNPAKPGDWVDEGCGGIPNMGKPCGGGGAIPLAPGIPLLGIPPVLAIDARKLGSDNILRIIGSCNIRPSSGFEFDI